VRFGMRGKRGVSMWFGAALVAVAAIAQAAPAPVHERPQPPTRKILTHLVSSGETLYVIAWRYELDFQSLADANGLQPPYELRPGQRLSLDVERPSTSSTRQVASAPAQAAPQTAGGGVTTFAVEGSPALETGSGLTVTEGVSQAPAEPHTEPVWTDDEEATAMAIFSPQLEEPPPRATTEPTVSPPLAPASEWLWPLRGRVEKEYDAAKVQKGINIYPEPGAAVHAAAPGVVVYAGNGLRGYGNLLIIKHSDKHLSAYAHNKTLLVDESQSVSQGQKIAEVGTNANSRLYFEIRENGKPVDPLELLPKQ